MEKIRKGVPGFTVFIGAGLLIIAGIAVIMNATANNSQPSTLAVMVMLASFIAAAFLIKGLTTVPPNIAIVLTFFGKSLKRLEDLNGN